MSSSTRIRAFVAIPLDSELKGAVQKLQNDLQIRLRSPNVRWTKPDQLHLTLKFLGDVPSDEIPAISEGLLKSCCRTSPLRLSIGGVGCFPSPTRPRIIWLGIAGDLAPLEALQKAIDDQTKSHGPHVEEREFHPHLTIGRIKTAEGGARRVGEMVSEIRIEALGHWNAREVELIQSTLSSAGSSYQILAKFALSSSK